MRFLIVLARRVGLCPAKNWVGSYQEKSGNHYEPKKESQTQPHPPKATSGKDFLFRHAVKPFHEKR